MMRNQDRDMHLEAQREDREMRKAGQVSGLHWALMTLRSSVRIARRAIGSYLHPKAGDISVDGRRIRRRISTGALGFRIACLTLFALLFMSSVYRYVFWDPESYMTRSLFPSLLFLAVGLFCLWLVYHPYEWVLTPEARQDEAEIERKAATAKSGSDGVWNAIGDFVGLLGALLAFLAVYAAAIGTSGWVVGIALGWIPAILAALVAGSLFRYFWWVIVIGVLGLIIYLV